MVRMLGLLFFLFALAGSAQAAERTLRVGLYQNSPKIDVAQDGRAEGIFADTLAAIAAAEGWTIEYIPGTWNEGLARLQRGDIDVMPDVARTPERERIFAFHDEPVVSSWSQVYARGDSGIRSLLDLHGRRVAVLDGSVQEAALERMLDDFRLSATLVKRQDFPSAFAAVGKGEADAVATNHFFGLRNAQRYGLEDTAIVFSPAQFFFVTSKSADRAILAAIDRHLVALKKNKDSAYYRSLHRWSVDEAAPRMPAWLPGAALTMIGLLAGIGAWTLALRRQVAAKTAEISRFYEISRQHATELEIRVAERTHEIEKLSTFLQGIIDHIPNPIFYKGPDLRFRGCNNAYEHTFGVARHNFIGKTVLDLDYLPLADREAYQSEDARITASGATLCREATIPFADGREHQTLYSISGFLDRDGKPEGMVGVIVDITPLKEAEAAMRDAKQRAESADRLKSAFLATMSHELRTPLNSIIGFTGVMLQELAGPLNGEQKKQLGMVRDSARHLLALINDVLDISKIEAGEFRIASEAFNLAASIEKVGGIIRPLAHKKGLALDIAIGDGVGESCGDSRRVEQILLNLLGNAIKFTDHGAVSLRAERVDGIGAGRNKAGAPSVRIAIADTGIGIPPEDMTILFQPFRQVESTMARNHEGTGLGLAICLRLAHMMGGSIEASSRWQEGSVFTLTLPITTPDGEAA